jgi:hypothetical protein
MRHKNINDMTLFGSMICCYKVVCTTRFQKKNHVYNKVHIFPIHDIPMQWGWWTSQSKTKGQSLLLPFLLEGLLLVFWGYNINRLSLF